ncbi:MAG: PEGA domain-containing protein [Myxococcales bacterium]
MNQQAPLLLSLVLSTGCATLTAPKTAPLYVTSDVPGAEVKVDGVVQGRTPYTVNLERTREQTIEVSAPGYQPQTCRPRMSAGMFYLASDAALCVVFFPLGCISFIDATGAWNEPDVKSCDVKLQPAWAHAEPLASAPPQPFYAPANPPSAVTPGAPPPGYRLVPVNPSPQQQKPAYQPPPGYQLVPVQPPPPGYQWAPAQQTGR